MDIKNLSKEQVKLILYILNTDIVVIKLSKEQKETLIDIYVSRQDLSVGDIETIGPRRYISIWNEHEGNCIMEYDYLPDECIDYLKDNLDEDDIKEIKTLHEWYLKN